jgi:Skp family chaperone for outer membrane proteins
LQAKIQQIHQQFQTQFQADAQATVDEYNQTKADLDRQFAALHGADVGATGAVGKQLADLQKKRSDLYDKIVAQIQSETSRIAKDRGLKVAFDNVEAAVGGYDLTDEVSKDVESLHE